MRTKIAERTGCKNHNPQRALGVTAPPSSAATLEERRRSSGITAAGHRRVRQPSWAGGLGTGLDAAHFRRRKRNEAPLASLWCRPRLCSLPADGGAEEGSKEGAARQKKSSTQAKGVVSTVTSTIPVPPLEKTGASFISNRLSHLHSNKNSYTTWRLTHGGSHALRQSFS